MKKKALTHFESLAQRLVEGSFGRLFGQQLELLDVAGSIARAMGDSTSAGYAATTFYVTLSSEDYEAVLASNPQAAQLLASYVTQLAHEAEFELPDQPQVTLAADPQLGRRKINVQIESPLMTKQPTTKIFAPSPARKATAAAIRELDAFLIVDGRSHKLLDKPLLTIGRRAENDIVLNAASVSRRHAQLRWRFGHFVLYDISRRGQTKVNGRSVTEFVLQAGDVISLGEVQLIYGEGHDGPLAANQLDDDAGGATMIRSQSEL